MRSILAAGAAAALAAGNAPAQTVDPAVGHGGMSALVQGFQGPAPPNAARRFSGVSAFGDPVTSREYAVACTSDGVLVADVTPPPGPTSGPFVPAAAWWLPEPSPLAVTPLIHPVTNQPVPSTDTPWREAVTRYDAGADRVYVYVVNQLHPGIWIVVFHRPVPGQPLVLDAAASQTWQQTATVLVGANRIENDRERQQIYVTGVMGSGNAMQVFSVQGAAATNPQFLGSWQQATHDAFVVGNTLIVAELARNFRFFDISGGWTNQQPYYTFVGPTPFASHSCWSDGSRLWAISESHLNNVAIADLTATPPQSIGNLSAIAASGSGPTPAVVHHIRSPRVRGRGNLAGVLAHYQDGVQIVDLSVPPAMPILADRDTSALIFPTQPPQTWFLDNFTGVWDVAVDQDSGLVYASQVEDGLWVLRADRALVNRFWPATSQFPGGLAPRIAAPGAPARAGRALVLIDENWGTYGRPVLGVLNLSLAEPAAPLVLPSGIQIHLDPAFSIGTSLAAGQVTIHVPANMPPGLRVFSQILLMDLNGLLAASRGAWVGLGG